MNREGEVINGIKIIAYRKSIDIDVMFKDGTILKNVEYGNLKKGHIKNPFEPKIYNIGFIGIGKYDYINNLTAYRTWHGMIKRCYNESNFIKHPTYKDCTVHSDWHNFQNFAKWFYENYKDGFQMDKDYTCFDNKVYSQDTCVFIPQELNKLFSYTKVSKTKTMVGVDKVGSRFKASLNKGKNKIYLGYFDTEIEAFSAYKKAKEDYVKEQAFKFRNDIGEIVYNNLMNYIV